MNSNFITYYRREYQPIRWAPDNNKLIVPLETFTPFRRVTETRRDRGMTGVYIFLLFIFHCSQINNKIILIITSEPREVTGLRVDSINIIIIILWCYVQFNSGATRASVPLAPEGKTRRPGDPLGRVCPRLACRMSARLRVFMPTRVPPSLGKSSITTVGHVYIPPRTIR